MNKKLLLLSVLLLTAVVGCKNKSNNSASQGSNSDSTEQVSTDEAAEGTSQAQIRQVDPALSGSDALEAIKKNYKGKVAFSISGRLGALPAEQQCEKWIKSNPNSKNRGQSSFTSPAKPLLKKSGRTV